jgi:hypothetical protein
LDSNNEREVLVTSILTRRKILLISPQRWDDIYVSKHHYAMELARRSNIVCFLNPPSGRYSISKTCFENIFSLDYPGYMTGLRFFPGFLQRYLMRCVLRRLEKITGLRFDIIWSFDNSVFFDFDAFKPDALKICHIVDLNQDFHFSTSAMTADLCMSTNRHVVDKFKRINVNSFFINHGLAIKHAPVDRPNLPGMNHIKVGYAGNLDIPYLDWSLLNRLHDENPQVDIILAGPWKNRPKRVLSNKNHYYLGVLSDRELMSFYSQVDVLIICYLADEFPDQLANPHKMMEYLGSGKAVCATFTSEYSGLARNGMFLMSQTNAEYPELFKKCIQDLDFWNSKELSERRVEFAKQHSYEQQLEAIEGLINNLLLDSVDKMQFMKLS